MKCINFAETPELFYADSEFEQAVARFIADWNSPSTTVAVKTSGSTGVPKLIEAEKNKMQHSAMMTCEFLNINKGDTALLCLPTEYISGKMMIVRSMVKGLKLYVSEPALSPLEAVSFPIDFCAMTPLQVEHSLNNIYHIKNLIIGGAAVSETLKKSIFTAFTSSGTGNSRIFETFGMSETLSHIALKQIYPQEEPFFTVLNGVDISRDERGCLKIFAPKLNPNVLQTNDLVEMVGKNQFRFLGRLDNVINSGGAKIFPEELEALAKKEITKEIVFIGLADEQLGQRLTAVVEGAFDEEIKQTINGLEYSRSFHRPKDIIFIDRIPRTPNGKISRLALKSLLQS